MVSTPGLYPVHIDGWRVLFPLRNPCSPPPHPKENTCHICFLFVFFFTENPISLPAIGDSEVYVNSMNMQYHDDSEDFLHSEVLSNYGDLLVGFSSLAALQNR